MKGRHLICLGVLLAVGCSASSGSEGYDTAPVSTGPQGPAANDQAVPGSDQKALTNDQLAPRNDQSPLGADQSAPAEGSAAGQGTMVARCSGLCTQMAAAGCDVESDCAAECAEGVTELFAVGCGGVVQAYFGCIEHQVAAFCASQRGDDDQASGSSSGTDTGPAESPQPERPRPQVPCEAEAVLVEECVDAAEPDEPAPPPSVQECTLEGDSCAGCSDACSTCMCTLDDAGLCADLCRGSSG